MEVKKKRHYICGGYWTWTDCGNEFDCEYDSGDIGCEDCIVNKHLGGKRMPKGMKWKMVDAQREKK